MNRNIHLNATFGETGGKCNECSETTVLVTALDCWNLHNVTDDTNEEGDGDVTVCDEISGHFCRNCNRLTALFFNQGTN